MKFKLLLILLFFELLNAVNTDLLSQKLKQIICKKESVIKCNSNSYFVHDNHYLKLDNNRLLVFFKLLNPNSSPYTLGTQNAIVIFDTNHDWKLLNKTLDGSVSSIKRDPNGGIWVSHPWSIEGTTTPALSYTTDGVKWNKVTLPNKRAKVSIEWMRMCLLANEIALRFSGEGKQSYWKTSYNSALKTNPNWKEISKNEYNSQHCLNADAKDNNWQKISSQGNLAFIHEVNSNKLVIPNKIKIKSDISNLYSIQIGHFKLKENLEEVAQQLNEIIGYPIISKEFSDNKYKLFLGTFKTAQEAKDALNRLKRKYKKNRYINEAFVTQLPR